MSMSISGMGATTPPPHSRAYFRVLECRLGVMRASLIFATLTVFETPDYAKVPLR